MSCEKTMTGCAPCQECPPETPPLLPRCNNVFPDGVYTNATIVVEEGCITEITQGHTPLYQPADCCAPVGGNGGGGEGGLDGPKGDPGQAATIAVGSVSTVPYGQPAEVTNTGTANAAIFNFKIPRGPAGADGETPTGVTNDTAGIDIQDGAVKALPVAWPPILTIGSSVGDIIIQFSKDPATGFVTTNVDTTQLMSNINSQIEGVRTNLQTQIDDLTSKYNSLKARLDTCCPPV